MANFRYICDKKKQVIYKKTASEFIFQPCYSMRDFIGGADQTLLVSLTAVFSLRIGLYYLIPSLSITGYRISV